MEPINILYVYGGVMSHGGIETFLMNNFRNINSDKIHIDFVVHGFEEGVYDKEIIAGSSKIYHVPVKSKNFIGNYRALRKIFTDNSYSTVHVHMDAMNSWVLKIAQQCKVPIRISHSHNTNHLTNNKLQFLMHEYAKNRISAYATNFMACSEKAGRWLYGDKLVDDGNVLIVPNAINIEDYKYDFSKREKIFKEFNISDELIIGHIGRFDYQKNHDFLLEIFKNIHLVEPNSKLLLVGDGHLKDSIKNKIHNFGLDDNVILAGNRNDIPALLSAMDLFLFPSLFEGLGIVLIEAQANGLDCLISSTIPREVKITELVHFKNLEMNVKQWAEGSLQILYSNKERANTSDELEKAGYSIISSAKKIQDYYIRLVKEV